MRRPVGRPWRRYVGLLVVWTLSHAADGQEVWDLQDSGTQSSLRGLCAIDQRVVWASGTGGTVIRTIDGGENWENVGPADAPNLDFRDIHALDAQTAVILSAGQPARIYRTEDGGENWTQCYEDLRDGAFYDAMTFSCTAPQNGLAFSDPINGRLVIIQTSDGGKSWHQLPRDQLPQTRPGEAGFAASGTCIANIGNDHWWIATGGAAPEDDAATARVFYSADRGHSWQASSTPLAASPSSGIFSLAFSDSQFGVAVGGDYARPEDATSNVAFTRDGGRSWEMPSGAEQKPRGYRSCVAVLTAAPFELAPGSTPPVALVAVGPSGTDCWDGRRWMPLSEGGFHAVAFAPCSGRASVGWAVGSEGRVGRWNDEQARRLAQIWMRDRPR